MSITPTSTAQQRRDSVRTIKDIIARYMISVGGISVVIAIVLIFVYLLSVVYPIFNAAKLAPLHHYQVPGEGKTLYLGIDEQFEIGVRVNDLGRLVFFNIGDGKILSSYALPIPNGVSISSFAEIDVRRGWFALGLDNGAVLVASHQYQHRFVGETRYIDPLLVFPLGEDVLQISEQGDPLQQLAIADDEEQIVFAARVADGIQIVSFLKEEGFSEDSIAVEQEASSFLAWSDPTHNLLLEQQLRTLYAIDPLGVVSTIDISDKSSPALTGVSATLAPGAHVAKSTLLLGGFSLLIADSGVQPRSGFLCVMQKA